MPGVTSSTVDVLFDGQRIWSFKPSRDGVRTSRGQLVGWPHPLGRFLEGRCEVVLREHVSGRVLYDETVQFGSGQGSVRVVDKRGDALAIDKSGRLVRVFSGPAGASVDQLLGEVERLLDLLNDKGEVSAFLAYGGLLGAVRAGRLIGHDFDLDVSYLSAHVHPVDVILESYRLERLVRRSGWSTRRMSADDFKVLAAMEDGGTIGIDVFGSFYVEGVYHLMGEIRGELPASAIVPLSTVELEGRRVTAPADPEALLALTYGKSWRVPDPAFKFTTPASTRRRLTGWMRGERAHLRYWERFYGGSYGTAAPRVTSQFAEWVGRRLPEGGRVVDLGAGAGRDAVFFAREGYDVVGHDYCGGALGRARVRAKEEGVTAQFLRLNLYEMREVLSQAALRAHEGQTAAIYARLLLDALRDDGRRNLWTYARMVLRGGGRLYLEFSTPDKPGRRPSRGYQPIRALASDLVVGEVEAAGGVVEHCDVARGRGGLRDEDPAVCRLVVRWS